MFLETSDVIVSMPRRPQVCVDRSSSELERFHAGRCWIHDPTMGAKYRGAGMYVLHFSSYAALGEN